MVSRISFVQRRMPGVFFAVALLLVMACGGGGAGGSSYSLSVSPAAVTFTTERFGALPAGQSITASYTGDGLLVGYPTGVTPPAWLSATQASSTGSSALINLEITTTDLAAGSYATTLRFVTGKSDGTNLVTRDVPITYRVSQGLEATELAFAFTAGEGVAPAPQTLHLSSDLAPYAWNLRVEASGAGPTDWLTVSSPTGNASAPTTVQVQVAARSRGAYGANLVLRTSTGLIKATIPVTYAVNGVFDLVGTFNLNLDQGSAVTALTLPMTLQTHLDASAGAAQHWQITSSQPWISISPSSGDLSSNTTLTAHLDPAFMGSLPNGSSPATLSVRLTASSYSDLSVPFVLNLNLPQVGHVAPYATWTGRTSPVILRGSGFLPGTSMPVRFGAAVATGTVVSDTEIHVTAPSAPAASRLGVSIDNALGIVRTGAELAVLPQPGYTATSLTLPYIMGRMVSDPERQALLMVSGTGIQRVRFQNGTWSQDSLTLPDGASGIFVGLDGKDLLATSGSVLTDNDQVLRLDPETFVTRDTRTASGYYENFALVASFNDGRTFVFDSDQWLSALQYPDMTPVNAPSVHGAIMLVTRDHSRILLHTTSSSGDDAYYWDADDASYTLLGYGDRVDVHSWSVSQDGGRYLKGLELFDRGFQKLGDLVLPVGTLWAATLSPDGATAYTLGYLQENATFVLRKTNLTAANGPYSADATPLALDLAVGEIPDQLLVSEDGGTLFVLIHNSMGTGRFIALPLS